MKFKGTITKIDEEGVRAKTDNPIQRPSYQDYSFPDDGPSDSMLASIEADMEPKIEAWKESEANRKEYNVPNVEIYLWDDGDNVGKTIKGEFIKVGDRIEGDIINDQIVNVKIV